MPTVWTMKITFNQNKKMITINKRKESGQRGAKLPDSTINGGKSYPLVHIGDWIFKTTQRATYTLDSLIRYY